MPGSAVALRPGTAVAPRRRTAADTLGGEADTEQGRGAAYDAQAGQSRNRYLDFLGGGQESLNQSIKSAVSSGMPQLNASLQGARENANSRGVGLGELGTSYEGDVYSAFQKNIANSAGQQAMNLYSTQSRGYGDVAATDSGNAEGSRNRYLDILTGQRDYETAQANEKRKRRAGLFGGIGSVLGAVGGGALGSIIPGLGTAFGVELGSKVGGSFGRGAGG